MSTKNEIRKAVRARVSALTAGERVGEETSLFSALRQNEYFRSAQTIVLFHSLPDEVCTHEFLSECARTKCVLLPVVSGDCLLLKRYQSPTSMQEGAYRISEPTGEAFDDWQNVDLVIVPGVAFTAEGQRLGRGKGYYDRFLSDARLQRIHTIGICYACQIVAQLPTESHDVQMNEVMHG